MVYSGTYRSKCTSDWSRETYNIAYKAAERTYYAHLQLKAYLPSGLWVAGAARQPAKYDSSET